MARRRSGAPSKGDLRELKILGVLGELLATKSFDALTTNDIAERAGLSRASMYFYFSSKQEALVALFAKTVEALREKSRAAADDPAAPRDAIATAMRHTRDRWREHGLIMRVAIDQASAIPEIGALWTETAEIFIDAITAILVRAGVKSHDGPDGARALAGAVCWMIERTFYHASAVSLEALDQAAETCEAVWLRVAAIEP
ncbi:AcrR family transcriptional regulator [Amycolatopsis bartoniae]|uniref:TetR family transcriptional regulator n=1 Tax=Amycolatopsis bartoniae TaxID=941986 RepID=A0A8H9MD81_9PSEU|nr:TetR/AcrR family transcriptional regulator [Amycolatopsis bartoniae]MBB2936558.1 AcrR family transcriptional regulator [Amycolatopsis bartoniae]TVT10972.1 TetR/AcrR family transcriptional regulator [Amycolatopsis bartoniae]GHF68076.1 TetR family transcriptional regulator [Amycolatopsis bartoniae]